MDKLIQLTDGIYVMASEVVSFEVIDAYCGIYQVTLKDGRKLETFRKTIVDEINHALAG